MQTITGLTAEDLLARPADDNRYELIEGELRSMEPAGFFHGITGIHLTWPLAQWVEEHDLGLVTMAETGYRLQENPDTVLAPDIGFVSKARLEAELPKRGFFPGAPDLAVEIISPSETMDEVDQKVQKYLEAGTRLIWIVRSSSRRIEVHRAGGESQFLTVEDSLDGEDVVPGFELPVARVFR